MKPTISHAENANDITHLEILRKRALFRSSHRGCKEMDLVMGQFAEQKLETLAAPMLELYDQLLDEDDMLIWDWVIGRNIPDQKYAPLVALLKQYAPDSGQ